MTFGVAVALGERAPGSKRWFAIAAVNYELHVLMDAPTLGRGVMLAWPVLSDRVESPVKLFYGPFTRHTDGRVRPTS